MPKESKVLILICWLAAAAALIAAIGVFLKTESIVISAPIIAVWGLLLAHLAQRRRSQGLLFFGLLGPLMTVFLSLLIACLQWRPDAAELTARMLYVLNACASMVGAVFLTKSASMSSMTTASHGESAFRFSILALLVIITLTGLLLRLFQQFWDLGPYVWFACFGITVLSLSILISLTFLYSKIRRDKETSRESIASGPETTHPGGSKEASPFDDTE